jgi:hypothetical protein
MSEGRGDGMGVGRLKWNELGVRGQIMRSALCIAYIPLVDTRKPSVEPRSSVYWNKMK